MPGHSILEPNTLIFGVLPALLYGFACGSSVVRSAVALLVGIGYAFFVALTFYVRLFTQHVRVAIGGFVPSTEPIIVGRRRGNFQSRVADQDEPLYARGFSWVTSRLYDSSEVASDALWSVRRGAAKLVIKVTSSRDVPSGQTSGGRSAPSRNLERDDETSGSEQLTVINDWLVYEVGLLYIGIPATRVVGLKYGRFVLTVTDDACVNEVVHDGDGNALDFVKTIGGVDVYCGNTLGSTVLGVDNGQRVIRSDIYINRADPTSLWSCGGEDFDLATDDTSVDGEEAFDVGGGLIGNVGCSIEPSDDQWMSAKVVRRSDTFERSGVVYMQNAKVVGLGARTMSGVQAVPITAALIRLLNRDTLCPSVDA